MGAMLLLVFVQRSHHGASSQRRCQLLSASCIFGSLGMVQGNVLPRQGDNKSRVNQFAILSYECAFQRSTLCGCVCVSRCVCACVRVCVWVPAAVCTGSQWIKTWLGITYEQLALNADKLRMLLIGLARRAAANMLKYARVQRIYLSKSHVSQGIWPHEHSKLLRGCASAAF